MARPEIRSLRSCQGVARFPPAASPPAPRQRQRSPRPPRRRRCQPGRRRSSSGREAYFALAMERRPRADSGPSRGEPVSALLSQVLISRANIGAPDHAWPARSPGNPQFKRSTAAPSVKARPASLVVSRTAAAARGHPHRPNDFIFSTVESAPTNRVFQSVRSGAVDRLRLKWADSVL
jgi:hypothetical protein